MSSIGSTCAYPPPAAPPFTPKQGPRLGSRKQITARTVAMAANRLLDARLDALNPRTARRAIPSGALSGRFYLAILLACAVTFFPSRLNESSLACAPLMELSSLPVIGCPARRLSAGPRMTIFNCCFVSASGV